MHLVTHAKNTQGYLVYFATMSCTSSFTVGNSETAFVTVSATAARVEGELAAAISAVASATDGSFAAVAIVAAAVVTAVSMGICGRLRAKGLRHSIIEIIIITAAKLAGVDIFLAVVAKLLHKDSCCSFESRSGLVVANVVIAPNDPIIVLTDKANASIFFIVKNLLIKIWATGY